MRAIMGFGVDRDEKVAAMLATGADPLVRDGDGFTALERVVAGVADDAPDAQAAYRSFLEGLPGVAPLALPGDRTTLVQDAMPAIRAFARDWARGVPEAGFGTYEAKRRAERLACIEHLAAHGAWARRRGQPPPP